MLRVLRNPTYAKLFGAQIIALIGTGLLTVALGLLAFDIAGGDAGVVMGVAMSIKMIAYVVVSPVMIALVARLPKRPVSSPPTSSARARPSRCRSSPRSGRSTS